VALPLENDTLPNVAPPDASLRAYPITEPYGRKHP